ncbi:hypothetical protein ISW38_001197 [Salmonella enterica]|nr:hypothetical protein [Salmonella enterica]
MVKVLVAATAVFPAPAGINRRNYARRVPWGGVPRASGDKPASAGALAKWEPCSPRQRG